MSRKPLRRKDAFFGLHFDLHASEDDTSLGADVTEENIAQLLSRVQPDFVQYDCKGHPGYTGYPTKVGWPSPGIVNDALAVWRKVTREHGVALLIHYSGIWDTVAVQHRPEWARVDENGEPDAQMTSTFGPYVDELMIPQLKEVVGAYDLDGLWVDGDCWTARLDYSEAALATWREETGYEDTPKDPSDPRWPQWKQFHRRQYEQYLCHWVDALHQFKPELDITSNWMYSTRVPKPIVANLVGMGDQGWSHKSAIHLQQEAAVVLMQGGTFQVYFHPTRSGHILDFVIETAGQVADFCRARQAVSYKSTSVPQVVLLLPSELLSETSGPGLLHSHGMLDGLQGALHALLQLRYSVDIMAEHQLRPCLHEFPLVVISEVPKLAEGFDRDLLDYVRQGGNLLLLGERCARLFETQLGVVLEGEPTDITAYLCSCAGDADASGLWQQVSPVEAEVVGAHYPILDARYEGQIAATLISYGKGTIAAVYGPASLAHFRTHHPALRDFIGGIVHRLFPEPIVAVEAPPCVDISLRRTHDGHLTLHLLNLAGAQRAPTFLHTDFVPTIGPIQVKMNVADGPTAVRWAPDGNELDWSWSEGMLTATIPHLHIHGALVVE